jgi:hypothetical protein
MLRHLLSELHTILPTLIKYHRYSVVLRLYQVYMAGCNLEILQVEKKRSGRTRHSEHGNQQIIK